MPTNWKVCCQPNRSRTQDRLFRPQCRRYGKLQIMMPASLSFPTAGNITLPPSSWTHTRRMRTMRTSSPAYHAWYMMRWDERGKGLLVIPPISFDTGYILQKSIAVVLVIYAATIMLKPVADNQIIHFQHHVVVIWSKPWVISISGALYSTIIRAVRSRR